MLQRERSNLGVALLLLAVAFSSVKAQTGPKPSSSMYDSGLHLFVDDSGLQRSWQMSRVLGVPERRSQALIIPDKPWEIGPNRLILNYGGFGSVIYDPEYKKFRMWYSALNGHEDPDLPEFMCYAESEDGIHWIKPPLGLIEFRGSKDNNIVYSTAATTFAFFRFAVLRDENETDPAKRYKGIGWHPPGFFALLTSPGGLHWSGLKDVSSIGGDTISIAWDPIRKLYMMMGRGITLPKDQQPASGPVRTIGVYGSPTMDRWRYQGLGINLDADAGFGINEQHWTLNPFVYGDQYLGVLNVSSMREKGPDKRLVLATSRDGRSWQNRLELVSSRDGREWHYVSQHQDFLAPSPDGYWDATLLCLATSPPIPVGDKVYLYYNARAATYDMGMAEIRRDRFAGLRSGDGELMTGETGITSGRSVEPAWGNFHAPYVLTKLVKVTGPKLEVNLDTKTGGVLRVSVRQPDDRDTTWGAAPVPGYTSQDCIPLSGDGTRLEVHWKGHADLRDLVGKQVALMFELKDGTLWSYRFGQ